MLTFLNRRLVLTAVILLPILLLLAILTLYTFRRQLAGPRIQRIGTWFANPAAHADWQLEIGTRCGNAPMIFPTTGFIGVGWGDGIRPFYRHTGYDIFSPSGAENVTPNIAAYDGYLTREDDWLSTVIIRHPDFPPFNGSPLSPGEQIWSYYTHMASADGSVSYVDPAFPPGTHEKFVTAGTLLGYQGTWSGRPNDPVGLHLHFSIAASGADGSYTNETEIGNTYDPGLFLGLTANEEGIIGCWE